MGVVGTGEGEPSRSEGLAFEGDASAVGGSLGLIVAGAHARGVADALEALDLPAVLIDETGAVLHVAPAAAALLASVIDVDGSRLVGRSADAHRRLRALVDEALRPGRGGQGAGAEFRGADGATAFEVRVIRMPAPPQAKVRQVRAALVVSAKARDQRDRC